MQRRVIAGAVSAVVLTSSLALADPHASGGIAALTLVKKERARLDRGDTVVKVLGGGPEVAVFCAIGVRADGEALITWTRQVESLQRGRYIPAIGRFSQPPQLEDLDELTLDEEDLEDLRRCVPGDCGIKLNTDEIARMNRRIEAGGANWKDAAQEEFRAILLARAQRYLTSGHGSEEYHDREAPASLSAEFDAILERFPFLTEGFPSIVAYLRDYPQQPEPPGVDSLLYWAKESLGARPTVSITHSVSYRPEDPDSVEGLVVSKQVYASHYMTGSLAATAIMSGGPDGSGYLLYFNRSRLDMLEGLFGRFVRRVIERRVRAEAPDVLRHLQRRLESGESRH